MAFRPMALRGPRLIWRLSRRLTCRSWSPGFMLTPNPSILFFDRRSAYSSDFDVGFEGEMISRRKREHSSPRKPLGEGPLSPKHFLGLQRRPFNDSSRNTTDGRISLNRASRYTVSILMGLHLSVLGARVKGHSRALHRRVKGNSRGGKRPSGYSRIWAKGT
ncbi:hypothetical protein Pst134EA_024671 [Puccinia striiformis f. sp. tritici]|uniref:hypothetical protein n=1 Tax=Puccinia striiformis f. sp. tritici TaxID=168172 RepID=UPI002007DCDC|nr:hypothetical protein Pst134EA_024671 [Puccinia striiformis f. sp. tritici]KAH9453805.1 hypothetical protein Pst134EA_024671 [Puccinia striiformis f. sp. tritici]KAI9625315.1 hypothetical protein H4Q26_016338 [Puccinia striiformis f. sp. tritici PST-130]